jgi:hypothetical protein
MPDKQSIDTKATDSPSAWAIRLSRWESGPRSGPALLATRRFFSINGLDLGALMALELFTTVLPILLIGVAWFEHFHSNENIGDLFLDQLGVHGSLATFVRGEFGNAAELHPIWTLLGVMGYLVWGIPMSMTVARVFAAAWVRPMHTVFQRIWRGAVWFAIYVLTLLINHRLALFDGPVVVRLLLVPVAFAVSALFWGSSPMLLVRGAPRTRRAVLVAGVTGAVVMLLMRTLVIKIVFPLLLSGWDGFGPIGVAFTIMTWCGVNGIAWVAIACMGAAFTEPTRGTAPPAEASGAVL